jgi:CubicO group peptidase (beta-lactamase class C family)
MGIKMRLILFFIVTCLSVQVNAQDSSLLKSGHSAERATCGGINSAALTELVEQSSRTSTDALIVLKDDKKLVEQYSRPSSELRPLMSVTKSIVSLAIGKLISDGKIKSIDEPLSTWFPEWKAGLKAKVTLRHILSQTSGLSHQRGDGLLASKQDRLSYVRGLEIIETPGLRFSYNNEATVLLAGIVKAASGESIDQYVAKNIFRPMGITHWSWEKDPAGTVMAYWGLSLEPKDLARIGQMMLHEGRWENKTIVPREWATLSISPSTKSQPNYGLLWWILYSGSQHDESHRIGYWGNGWQGEYLVVYPRYGLVAVRMRIPSPHPDEVESQKYGFDTFPKSVLAIVNPCPEHSK